MLPKISVIVPVYNAQNYLHLCIKSILSQSFTNWELLLVDDGSKDDSKLICDEYAAKDNRIRVFHKENGGVSSARNLGIENAIGEWITFVDSDDYISSDYCQLLLDNNGEDFIISSYALFGDFNDELIIHDSSFSKEQLYSTLGECLSKPHFSTPWGKLFKRSILQSSGLRFLENIDSTEDTLFVYGYLLHVRSLRQRSAITYYYRLTSGGLSCKNLSVGKAITTIRALYDTITALEEEYNTNLLTQFCNIANYIYLRSIRYVKSNSLNLLKRRNLISDLHSCLPLAMFKEYIPAFLGWRGKLFYYWAGKQNYFLLSLLTYCVPI